MIGADAIRAGSAAIVLAGGMESMTNAPYLLGKARSGYRLGHGELLDHMFLDGLQNAYDGKLMGVFAEATARQYGFTRADQDAYAVQRRRLRAPMLRLSPERLRCRTGAGCREVAWRQGESLINKDEIPPTCDPAKLTKLKPAFDKDGTVTAASSSSIADGAAALLLVGTQGLAGLPSKPLARLVASAGYAQEPEWFTTAPVGAIRRVLERAGWQKDGVDLYEINEAFGGGGRHGRHPGSTARSKNAVNVNGGACALGHPIGASGARIITTLIHALRRRGLKRGIAALCIGGGEATAVAIEVADL